MTQPATPARERRRHRRFTPEKARAWCVSGEFQEMYTAVNFSRRLLNLSVEGICVETTGRLRPDVKMSVEVRFDDLAGTLRSAARIVWVQTLQEGGAEVHRAGMKFVGTPEITRPVREYLQGGRPALIAEKRRAEYQDLKRQSEERKEETVSRKWGLPAKLALTLLLLVLVYGGSFWGLVQAGRADAPGPGIRYRYAKGGGLEETLAKIYAPAFWVFRKAGIDLVYDPR